MPVLIDGDNLLGTWPGRRRSMPERRELAMQIGRLATRERKKMLVVFDGAAPPSPAFGAGTSFSGRGVSADDTILEILRGVEDPRGWLVVTSDRSLGDQCRYLGARVERSDRFRHRLRYDNRIEKPEREDDVDYWLEQFGDDEA
jgi:hypothetical protein